MVSVLSLLNWMWCPLKLLGIGLGLPISRDSESVRNALRGSAGLTALVNQSEVDDGLLCKVICEL